MRTPEQKKLENNIERLSSHLSEQEKELARLETELSEGGSARTYDEQANDIAVARVKLDVFRRELKKAEQALSQEKDRQKSPEFKEDLKEMEALEKAADKKAQAAEKLYEGLKAELDELQETCKKYDGLRAKLYGANAFSHLMDSYKWAGQIFRAMRRVGKRPAGQ